MAPEMAASYPRDDSEYLEGRLVNMKTNDEWRIEIWIQGGLSNSAASSSCVTSSTPDPRLSERPNPMLHEAECLEQIHEDPRLRLTLQEWEKNFQTARKRIETKWTRSINVKNELYQLIGFYSVYQGVVLTAVAQANDRLTCRFSWGPAALSLLASLATLASVHSKLKNYTQLKAAARREEKDSQVLFEKINFLKLRGKDFDFSAYEEDHGAIVSQSTARSRKIQRLEEYYYAVVMILLVLFSSIILASCIAILCHK